jgi:hypothetical protein
MPAFHTPAQSLLNSSAACLTVAVDMETLANGSNLPFLKPISITIRSLLSSLEVKSQGMWILS